MCRHTRHRRVCRRARRRGCAAGCVAHVQRAALQAVCGGRGAQRHDGNRGDVLGRRARALPPPRPLTWSARPATAAI
eukprot:3027055-Prymnesium_polylepis.1